MGQILKIRNKRIMEAVMARNGADESARIIVLETQVNNINASVEKLEQKIDNNYSTLHERISNLRDDLHNSIETKHDKLIEKLDEQAKSSTAQHAAIAGKVQSLEKWRWMIMGAAIVVGYVLAHIKLDRLF